MNKYQLTRTSYKNMIIFVDGMPLSGKTIIERILECYQNIELHTEIENLDSFFELYDNKNLDYNGLKCTLNLIMDRLVFNQNLGRYISMRPTDFPSIFTYPYPLKYIKRMMIKDKQFKNKNIRDEIAQKINNNESILHIPIHCAMQNASLLYDIFDGRIKIINIIRNPIDWLDGMIKYDIFSRIGTDPTTADFVIEESGVPFAVANWMEEYKSYDNIQRLLKFYIEVCKLNYNEYDAINKQIKDCILLVNFDELTTKPYSVCNEISKFIGRKYTYKIKRILKKENCPRNLRIDDRQKKMEMLINSAYSPLVKESEELYNKIINL